MTAAWNLPEPQPVQVTEHVWVPMSDGRRLSMRLWLPAGASREPAPAVLEYIPYRKRDSYRAHDSAWGEALASRGIAFARIDVRGTGDSEGVLTDEYTERELEDGCQCLDWLSRQAWCNGRLGMRGISWGAINTLSIAARRPPALKAIVAIAGTDCRYTDDAHYLGGLLGAPNLDWGVQLRSVLAGPPDPDVVGAAWEAMWLERLHATEPVIARWMRHQAHDPYWQAGSIELDYAAIRCPAYLVAGWFDTYANPTGRMLGALGVPKKGLFGPWGHTYPDSAKPGGVDWATEELRWWHEWLTDANTGIMAEPMVHAFMPYAVPREHLPARTPGRWIAESAWPPAVTVQSYWPVAGGRLASGPGEKGRLLPVPYAAPAAGRPEWLDLLPGEQREDDGRSLVFDSAPLEADLEILGKPELKIRLTADAPRGSITVRLTDVTPDGRSRLIDWAVCNLAFRDGPDRPEPLRPGELFDLDLPLQLSAHRFRKGNRIRLALGSSAWPLTVPLADQAGLALDSAQTRLELPVRAPEQHAAKLPMRFNDDPAKAAPAVLPPVTRADKGTHEYRITQPLVSWTERETGTELSVQSSKLCQLRADGTSSSVREVQRGWQRPGTGCGDWHCEVRVSCSIEAGATAFRVREATEAYRNHELVFSREHLEEIDRIWC